MQQIKQQNIIDNTPSSQPSSLSQDIHFLIKPHKIANNQGRKPRAKAFFDNLDCEHNIADLPSSTLHKSQDHLFLKALCQEKTFQTLAITSAKATKTTAKVKINISASQLQENQQFLTQKSGFQDILAAFDLKNPPNPTILASIICRICGGDHSLAFSNTPFLRFSRYKEFLFALSEVFAELNPQNPATYTPETLQEILKIDFSSKKTVKNQLKEQLSIIFNPIFINQASQILQNHITKEKALKILANAIKKPPEKRLNFAIQEVKNQASNKKITRYKTRQRQTATTTSFNDCDDANFVFDGDCLPQNALNRAEIYYALCEFLLFDKNGKHGIVNCVSKNADEITLKLDYSLIPKGQKQIITSQNKIRHVALQSKEFARIEKLRNLPIWQDFMLKKSQQSNLSYIFTSIIPKKTFASLRFKERIEHIINIINIFSCKTTQEITAQQIPLQNLAIIVEKSYSNDDPGQTLWQLLARVNKNAAIISEILNGQKANETQIRKALDQPNPQQNLQNLLKNAKNRPVKSKIGRYQGLQNAKQRQESFVKHKKPLQEDQLKKLREKLDKSEQTVKNLQNAFDNAIKTANIEIRKLEDNQQNLISQLEKSRQDRNYFQEKSQKLEQKLNQSAKNQLIITNLRQENTVKNRKIDNLRQNLLKKKKKEQKMRDFAVRQRVCTAFMRVLMEFDRH